MSEIAAKSEEKMKRGEAIADNPLVDDVAALLRCSRAQARASLDAVLVAISIRTLDRGFKTALRGFGAFTRDDGRLAFKASTRRTKE